MTMSEDIGVPGNGVSFPELEPPELDLSVVPGVEELVRTMEIGSLPGGWLYIHVAVKTVDAPMTKLHEMRKLNKTTLARKDRTMDKLVAKPFIMLSEYLMTTAVTSPPKT